MKFSAFKWYGFASLGEAAWSDLYSRVLSDILWTHRTNRSNSYHMQYAHGKWSFRQYLHASLKGHTRYICFDGPTILAADGIQSRLSLCDRQTREKPDKARKMSQM